MKQIFGGLSHSGWLYGVLMRGRPHGFGNLTAAGGKPKSFSEAWDWILANFDVSVTWADLEFIRSNWSGPIVVKGIHDTEDAREAARAGAAGIAVSKHVGRPLDEVEPSISQLTLIVHAAG